MENTEYLGDGVYAKFTGYSIEISVNDHRNPPVVHFDLDCLDKLKRFKDRKLKKAAKK